MKNLLSKRSLIFLVVALLAVLALAVSLLLEKKQLIDIYEGTGEDLDGQDHDGEDTEPEPVKPRKVGRPPKVTPEPEPETIKPAVEKPANEVENEISE